MANAKEKNVTKTTNPVVTNQHVKDNGAKLIFKDPILCAELSLVMLINKLKSSDEFKSLKDIPPEYLKNLENNTPEYLLRLISKIIAVLLYRINIPRSEVETFTDQIMRWEFSMLFDSFEAYDVQAVRKESRQSRQYRRLPKKSKYLKNYKTRQVSPPRFFVLIYILVKLGLL